jgi:hypothetical protein
MYRSTSPVDDRAIRESPELPHRRNPLSSGQAVAFPL